MKKISIILVILVVVAAIAFFSFFWPLNSTKDVAGTLGGVEKADKYLGDQPTAKDVLLENEDLANMLQSAGWQNAMKNEEFVAFITSEDFSNWVMFQNDVKKVVLAKACFDAVKSGDFEVTKASDETMKSVLANDFQKYLTLISQDFQKRIMVNSQAGDLTFSQAMEQIANENNRMYPVLVSSDMQKLVNSQDFEKMMASPQFENLSHMFSTSAQDFEQAFMSADIQKFVYNLASDMQKALYGGSLASDMQQDFYVSQDVQNILFSNDLQALNATFFLHSVLNTDYQQDMVSAFQESLQNGPGGVF